MEEQKFIVLRILQCEAGVVWTNAVTGIEATNSKPFHVREYMNDVGAWYPDMQVWWPHAKEFTEDEADAFMSREDARFKHAGVKAKFIKEDI